MSGGDGSFSFAQFRALVGVHVAEALRPGRNSEGIELRPLRQILVPMTLLGAWFAFGSRGESDPFRIRSLFLSSGVLAALAVLPDPTEAFARRRDVLGHLPVGRVTGGAARLAFLLVVLALLLGPYAAPTLAHVAWRGALGAGTLAALVVSLIGLALTGTGLWLSFAYLVASRFGVEVVRRFASLALSLVMLGVALLGSISIFSGAPPSLGVAAPLVEAAPTSWFVNLLLPDPGPRAGLEAGAAATLLALALALLARMRPESVYEQGRGAGRERDSLSVRLASLAERRLDAGGSALPLALLVARVASRESMTRMRSRSLVVSLLGVWILALFFEGAAVSLPVLAVFGFMVVAGGILDLAMSADAEASWAIAAAPLATETRVTGLRVAAFVRSAPLPALLVAGLAAWQGSWLDAVSFGAIFLAVSVWLASVALVLRPREPLATTASVAGGNAMLWLGLPLGLGGSLAFSPAWLFVDFPAPLALGAVAIYAGSLAAFAQGFSNWAAGRLRAAQR